MSLLNQTEGSGDKLSNHKATTKGYEMTISELIEKLEGFDEDLEVRIATQPSWPLQFRIAGVVDASQIDTDEAEVAWQEDHYEHEGVDFATNTCACGSSFKDKIAELEEDTTPAVYIVEGGHPWDDRPYAPRVVFERI